MTEIRCPWCGGNDWSYPGEGMAGVSEETRRVLLGGIHTKVGEPEANQGAHGPPASEPPAPTCPECKDELDNLRTGEIPVDIWFCHNCNKEWGYKDLWHDREES